MPEFYVVGVMSLAADIRLYAGGQATNVDLVECEHCGRNNWHVPDTVEVQLDHLGKRGFVESLWNSGLLRIFREDLLELWERRGLSGLERKPVKIASWSRKPNKPLPPSIPKYYVLTPQNRVRLNRPILTGPICPVCGIGDYDFPRLGAHLASGIQIDGTSWDGSDFFGLPGYAHVYCSRRAAEITLAGGFNRHIVFMKQGDFHRWEDIDIRKGWTAKAYEQYVESILIRDAGNL